MQLRQSAEDAGTATVAYIQLQATPMTSDLVHLIHTAVSHTVMLSIVNSMTAIGITLFTRIALRLLGKILPNKKIKDNG